MWSFDGERFSENPEPIRFARNERVRLRLVNDTMMAHPIHLHGHFFEIVNGQPPGSSRSSTPSTSSPAASSTRPDRRCARRLGVPLPPPVPHACRHDARRHRAAARRRAA